MTRIDIAAHVELPGVTVFFGSIGPQPNSLQHIYGARSCLVWLRVLPAK